MSEERGQLPSGPLPAPPPAPTPPELPESLFDPAHTDHGADRRLLLVILGAGVALAVMAGATILLWRPAAPSAPAAPAPQVDAAVTEAAPVVEPVIPAETPTVRIGGLQADAARAPEPVSDPAGLLRVLRATLDDRSGSDTERAWRLQQAVVNLSDSWAVFDRGTVEEANRLLAQHVIVAAKSEGGADDLLGDMGRGLERLAMDRLAAHEVWPAAWSAGAIAEIAARADASASVRGQASAMLASVGVAEGGGYYGAARAALERIPAKISGGGGDVGAAATWRRWSQAVDAAWSGDAPGRERAMLRGVGELLAAASTRASDPTTRSIVLTLLAGADWSERGAARDAVVGWLDDRDRIGSRELAAVTQWMVSGAPAAAIGVDHVLSVQADEQERARVRDALAARWSLSSPAMAEDMRAAWARAARSALSAGADGGPDAFARTARLARLGETAALLRRGEAAQARVALSKAASGRVAPGGGGSGGVLGADAAGRDGRWAVKFLGARRNAAERRAALATISVDGATLGVIDAEALIEAALFGSPVDVRDSALRIAERHTSEATVVNALLESLPRAPRTAASSRLYERAARTALPPVRDKAWPLAARRALVARLLESLDAGDGLSSIDEWAGVIGDAYSGWSVTLSAAAGTEAREAERREAEAAEHGGGTAEESAPTTDAARERRTALDPATAAAAAWEDLRAEVAALGDPEAMRALRDVSRRHAARRMLAEGGLQSFVAEQIGVLEALGLLTGAERPGSAAEAKSIIDTAESERRNARTIEEQMETTQTAILRMWLLLLGDGGRA